MAPSLDAGREPVRATYSIEGDRPVVYECYECVQAVLKSIHIQHYPNTDALAQLGFKELEDLCPKVCTTRFRLLCQSIHRSINLPI